MASITSAIMNKEFIAHRRERDGEIQSLWNHLVGTSELAGKFAAVIGLESQGELVGLLHDLGKASEEFLSYIQSATGIVNSDEDDYIDPVANKGKIDHSSAGAQFIHSFFSGRPQDALLLSQMMSLIIASHHSGLIDCIDPTGKDIFTSRMNKQDGKTHLKESEANLNKRLKERAEEILANEAFVGDFNRLICSLKEENDSGETYMFKVGLLTRFIFSCLIDADRINTADFEFPERGLERNLGNYVPWEVLIEKLGSYLKELETPSSQITVAEQGVDTIRQEISKSCFEFSNRPRGLYRLTVPTGGGKTLSSLRFALNHAQIHGMERIFYVIPYTSIIDQNADKTRTALKVAEVERENLGKIVLEHHSNLTPDKETSRQKLLSENWDAPIVFTTIVKFLDALFGRGTRDARRMHGLANSVIIFDEVQTIPVKCVHMFNMAVRFLVRSCGSTVVLCTATQPLLDKINPIQRSLQIRPEQEMIPDFERKFKELKRTVLLDYRKTKGWAECDVVDVVRQELSSSGSVLVVVNTKKEASNLFQQLRDGESGVAYHLSTNMCPAHRMKVLEEVEWRLEHKKQVICVSTQLIEAGIDIDFGSVIRYLAGLDSIAQAAGRCNRNGRRDEPGRVIIINPQEENLDNLKSIAIGRDKAERVLDEFKMSPESFDGDVLGPKAMKRYYEYFFFDRKKEMMYPVGRNSEVGREDNLFNLLSTNSISLQSYQRMYKSSPNLWLRQSFMTASNLFKVIDSKLRGVLVPYGDGIELIEQLCGASNLESEYGLLKAAKRYSIEIFERDFMKLERQGIIHEVQNGAGVFYLEKSYYDPYHGFSGSVSGDLPFLNPE